MSADSANQGRGGSFRLKKLVVHDDGAFPLLYSDE